ncbi:MAG: hypothetical protein UY57_C0019G0018, partial [Candidatus Kaiserbacteria bacterium GW2011_GWB1_50_17]
AKSFGAIEECNSLAISEQLECRLKTGVSSAYNRDIFIGK